MNRNKWFAFIAVQLLIGIALFALSKYPDAGPEVMHAAIFFYSGLSISSAFLILVVTLSNLAKVATRRAAFILAGMILKFLFILILLVIHLARGGFTNDMEGFVVIALYIIYGWMGYFLLKK